MRILIGILALLVLTNCSARQPIPVGVVPEQPPLSQEDFDAGRHVLADLSSQYQLTKDDAALRRVENIVDRLTRHVGGRSEPWNVYVFDAPEVVNAAATRGNHVFVWTGILGIAENDAQIATVLAHEVGHVIATHVREDPSEQMARAGTAIGQGIADAVASAYGGDLIGSVAGALTGAILESTLVNPESQRQELEADHIGLFLMAEAGYNPSEGVAFWRKAQNHPAMQGYGVFNFLSTHPSSGERVTELEKVLPQALERYRRSAAGRRSPSIH